MSALYDCILVLNNVTKHELEDLKLYLIRGLHKLSELLPNLPSCLQTLVEQQINDFGNNTEFKNEKSDINFRLLVQPSYEQLKNVIKDAFERCEIKESYVLYIGSHCSGYTSDWLLKDGILSSNTIINILGQCESTKEASHFSVNLISNCDPTYWSDIFSTSKDVRNGQVRALSFSTDTTEGILPINTEIETFAKDVCKRFKSLTKIDTCLDCLPSPGTHQSFDKNGSLYIFDEGCGQSSLLALDGFNLLIDAGYSHTPLFWKFIQHLDRIDTCLITSWNETNIFGIQALLNLKIKSSKNVPGMNYCILPIGPSTTKPCPQLNQKSFLEINLQLEAMQICNQLKQLEMPLLQMFREEKSIKSPHQLYFKLGHGFLEAFPLWPFSSETSEDTKRFVGEWLKPDKGQSIHFNEMIKDHSTACLLLWSESKCNETNSAKIMRILVSSSCSETQLIKGFEDFSKTNEFCSTPSGKQLKKKVDEKKSTSKRVIGHPKEGHNIIEPSKSSKSEKNIPPSSESKRSVSTNKAKESKSLSSEKTVPLKDLQTSEKKKILPDKGNSIKDNETTKKPVRTKSPIVKPDSAKKSTKAKDSGMAEKKQLKIEKPKQTSKNAEKVDIKLAAITMNETKKGQSEIISKNKGPINDNLNKSKATKQPSTRITDSQDPKKASKKPNSDNNSKMPIGSTNVKNTKISKTVKSEGDKAPLKTSKKFLDDLVTDKKSKLLRDEPFDLTVNKYDTESDPEKADAAFHQPSISFNTDDTLNNIDTSELLGKIEEIQPNEMNNQLVVTTDLLDLHSTPLSDMVTESPGYLKTEEDVEPLKTDGFSLEQDLLNANDDFPEDDKMIYKGSDSPLQEQEQVADKEVDDLHRHGIYDHENVGELLDDKKPFSMIEDKHSTDSLAPDDKDINNEDQETKDNNASLNQFDPKNQEYLQEEAGFVNREDQFQTYEGDENEEINKGDFINREDMEETCDNDSMDVLGAQSEDDNTRETDEDSLPSQENVIEQSHETLEEFDFERVDVILSERKEVIEDNKYIVQVDDHDIPLPCLPGLEREGSREDSVEKEREGDGTREDSIDKDHNSDDDNERNRSEYPVSDKDLDVKKCFEHDEFIEMSIPAMKEGHRGDIDIPFDFEDKSVDFCNVMADIEGKHESDVSFNLGVSGNDYVEDANVEDANVEEEVYMEGETENLYSNEERFNGNTATRDLTADHNLESEEVDNTSKDVDLEEVRVDFKISEDSLLLQFDPIETAQDKINDEGEGNIMVGYEMEDKDQSNIHSENYTVLSSNEVDKNKLEVLRDVPHELPMDKHEIDYDPLSYSPDLNSISPAESDLSADIVKDHSITDDTFENTEQTNVKLMTPLDELSEEGSPFGACQNVRLGNDQQGGAGLTYHSDEDINNITDLEVDPKFSNTTPDIIKGLKSMHLSGPGDHPVDQFIIDEDLFQFQPSSHAYNTPQQPQLVLPAKNKDLNELGSLGMAPDTLLFDHDTNLDRRSNFSEKWNSDESAASVVAQMVSNNDFDLRNIAPSTSIRENVEDGENSETVDTNPLPQWNEPLGLPLPTISENKPTSKLSDQKSQDRQKPSSSSEKSKIISPKLGGSLSISKSTQQTSDLLPRTSSPRPRTSSKSQVPKSTKKLDSVDHGKMPAFYVDVAFVPVDQDGNVTRTRVTEAFFTRIRAQQYILPGMEHDRLVLDSLLAGRKKWPEPATEVTLIPVKITETLKQWVCEHEQDLSRLNLKIGVAVENSSLTLEGGSTVIAAHRIDL